MKEKKIAIFFWILLIMLLLCGCTIKGQKKVNVNKPIEVYYLNKEETKIVSEEYIPKVVNTDDCIQELIEVMKVNPTDVNKLAAITDNFGVLGYLLEDTQLILNLDVRYLDMNASKEVLTRAALVRTLTQIKGVDYVSITIENEPLQDVTGNLVGTMTAKSFIENAGAEINTYEKVKLHLYFANMNGDGLIEINRTIIYNSNISLEKLVVEQIIAGPTNEESFPTMNSSTKILGVTVKDGICYVNLDEGFLTQPYNVNSDVTIYSLVNSLVELSNVNKVQISINGKTDLKYRENTDLSTFFERNFEILNH